MRPNIIVILTDQQRADTLGCYGNPTVRTPNLDALAEDGVCFERAYCSAPLCTPARVSIQTGAYPHRHGIVDLWGEVPNEQTGPVPGWHHPSEDVMPWLGHYFRDCGYETAYIGKWHCMTGANRRGFEDYIIRIGSYDTDIDAEHQNDWLQYSLSKGYEISKGKQNGADHVIKDLNYGVSLYAESDFPATFAFRKAIDFIKQEHEKPFILFLSETSPHQPFAPPAPYDEMYDASEIILSENVEHYASPKRFIELRGHPATFRQYREASQDQLKSAWAHYLGMVTHLDDLVGTLVEALSTSKLKDNTMLIYSSDHGEMGGSHRLQDKGAFMYEEVMKVPLLVHWPGKVTNARYKTPVSQVSLLPTLLELADIPFRSEMDMPSLAESFMGQKTPRKQPIFGEYNRFYGQLYPVRMVVDGVWKYVHYFGPEGELFDLSNDPGEMNNLVNSSSHEDILVRMQLLLADWMRKSGDVFEMEKRFQL